MKTNKIRQYRKQPVVINAFQWDGTIDNAVKIIEWVVGMGHTAFLHCDLATCPVDEMSGVEDVSDTHTIAIRTLEGVVYASKDDFVIQGVKGEFYPCKPDIFVETYESVDPSNRIIDA